MNPAHSSVTPFTVQAETEMSLSTAFSHLADSLSRRYESLPEISRKQILTVFGGVNGYRHALEQRWSDASVHASLLCEALGEERSAAIAPSVERALRPYIIQGSEASSQHKLLEEASLGLSTSFSVATIPVRRPDGALSQQLGINDSLIPMGQVLAQGFTALLGTATLRSRTYETFSLLGAEKNAESLDRILEFAEALRRPFDADIIIPFHERFAYGQLIVETVCQGKMNEYMVNYFADRVFHVLDSGVAFSDAQNVALSDLNQVMAIAQHSGISQPEDARDTAVAEFDRRMRDMLLTHQIADFHRDYETAVQAFLAEKQNRDADITDMRRAFSLALLPKEMRLSDDTALTPAVHQYLHACHQRFGPSATSRFIAYRSGLLEPYLSSHGKARSLDEGFNIKN